HLVVWQDNRNGNWDIYGYNLITRQEFAITDDPADQIHPAVSGTLVVWEDYRVSPSNIYYVWLEGPAAADCPEPPEGDLDGDCRISLTDFVRLAENWMLCARVPASACDL
ncbi:MAG TPA: hypothetical protein PKV53_11905, partial [Anaerohalosphaeraceae bacterium]|nr:hypothetical protein [Anaerohalosphaeraceae bacterium]